MPFRSFVIEFDRIARCIGDRCTILSIVVTNIRRQTTNINEWLIVSKYVYRKLKQFDANSKCFVCFELARDLSFVLYSSDNGYPIRHNTRR